MNTRVLCVDDDAQILAIVKILDHYPTNHGTHLSIETEQDAEQALEAVAKCGPYAVILSDMDMPRMNGVQFLSWVRQIAPDSIRMMLTGQAGVQVAIDAVNEGNIFRFLSKPVAIKALIKTLIAGIEQYRLIYAEKELLEKTLAGSIKAVTEILALADPVAFGRGITVRPLVRKVAAVLNVDNLWQFEVAAMLSQVACITVPDSILCQVYRGDTLTPEDTRLFEAHPQIGHRLVANIPHLNLLRRSSPIMRSVSMAAALPRTADSGRDSTCRTRLESSPRFRQTGHEGHVEGRRRGVSSATDRLV